jgi:multidrug efflux pump subunit AcrA (membrane-fusion protein)
MTARVDILTGERSDVLLVPVNAVFDRQGATVSHVVTRTGLETRPVQLGQSNDAEVEIVAGLREGDRVALLDAGTGQAATSGDGAARTGAPRRAAPAGNQLAPR